MIGRGLLLISALIWMQQGLALEPIPEEELASISGREGVALDFEFRMNAATDGSPLSNLSNCSGTPNPCVLALQLDNRGTGGGEWLVFKDTYGAIKLNSLFLDASETASVASAYPNPRRFLSQDGTSCLTGQGAGGANPTCTANGLPALLMSFEGGTGTFEADIEWFLNVGRMAVEYGPTGYSGDANGSFLGLRITDSRPSQNMAQIDIDGGISLIGF